MPVFNMRQSWKFNRVNRSMLFTCMQPRTLTLFAHAFKASAAPKLNQGGNLV